MLVMHTTFLTVTRLCYLIPIGISIVRMTLRSIEDIFPLTLKLNINAFNDFVTLGKIPKLFSQMLIYNMRIDLFQDLMSSCI